MNNCIKKTFLACLAIVCTTMAMAQVGSKSTTQQRAISPERMAKAKQMAGWLQNGRLPYSIPVNQASNTKPTNGGKPSRSLRPMLANATDSVTLTGYLISCLNGTEPNAHWVYSWPATTNPTPKGLGYLGYETLGTFYGGDFFDDGDKFCVIDGLSMFGMYFFTYYEYETKNWTLTRQIDLSDFSLMSTETAYDPVTDKIYGCFYSADAKQMEFGTVSYLNQKRTTIGTLSQPIMAMGATSKGVIYGVGLDGNLYNINKSTGQLTLVGATGVKPMASFQSGDIDHKTDTFYWTALNTDTIASLYTVDLNSGKATKVTDYANRWQWGAVNVLHGPEGAAPGKPENVSYDFSNGSTTGTLTFTVPEKTVDGNTLTSTGLNYYVEIDDSVYETGAATPGQTITTKQLALTTGNRYFRIYLHNEAGWGEKYKNTLFVGHDVPATVASITATADTANHTVKVSWTAPTKGKHDGYLEPTRLRYDLYRNDSLIANAISDTTLTDTIGRKPYYAYRYKVFPRVDNYVGDSLVSEAVRLGDPIIPPYSQQFNKSYDVDEFTILDNNKDGHTWEWGFYDDHDEFKTLKYHGANFSDVYYYEPDSVLKDADDWAFTPPMYFDANYSYVINFDYFAQSTLYPQKMEVKLGDAQTVEAMTTQVMPQTDVTNDVNSKASYRAVVSVPTSGVYYFGFHSLSAKNHAYYLHVDNLNVEQGQEVLIPDSVTGLTVKGNKADYHATVSFTTPTTTINGKKLSELSKVEVYRIAKEGVFSSKSDTVLVKSIDNPGLGQAIVVEDSMVNHIDSLMFRTNFGSSFGYGGNNLTYKVRASVGDFTGVETQKTAFIGLDQPLPPDSVWGWRNSETSATINWTAANGEHGRYGGWVDPEKFTYNVNGKGGYTTLATGVKGLTAEIKLPNTGKQELYNIGVTTRMPELVGNDYGAGPYFVVGAPWKLTANAPLSESFTKRKATNAANFFGTIGSRLSMQNTRDRNGGSSSSKRGSLRYQVVTSSEKDYTGPSLGILPRIDFSAVSNPELTFYCMGYAGDTIRVEAMTADGTTDTLAVVTEYADYVSSSSTKWTKAEPIVVSLKKYAGNSNVLLLFDFSGTTQGGLYIDDISIAENTTGISSVVFSKNEPFDVYSVDGRCVAKGITSVAGLAKGVYILRMGDKAMKVSVKN